MLGSQLGADLFPLPVIEETSQSDMRHNVVAHCATRGNQQAQRARLARLRATGGTGVHLLPQRKAAMRQSHSGAFPGLAHVHAMATPRTTRRRGVGPHHNVGNAFSALPALRIKLPDHLPEGGQLLERDEAVFFTPYRPKIASTCSVETALPAVASRAATLRASSLG